MAGDLVLLTGATGHLGFRVLRYALEQGYQVRAAVRSEAKAEAIRTNPALQRQGVPPGQLSFVVVPDILASDAYSKAVENVKYIIHVASPLSDSSPDDNDYEKTLVQPAIKGTINMLEAAARESSVKRVVITSSIMGVVPFEAFLNQSWSRRVTANDRIVTPEGPFSNNVQAYHRSKVAAHNEAEAWVVKQKPSFDLIHIYPSYIEGRNDMASTLKDFDTGTNRLILNIARGKTAPPNLIATQHVDDSALVHVLALGPKADGHKGFLVTSSGDDGTQWNDVRAIAKQHFPQAVEQGIFSTSGDMPSWVMKFDAKTTEDVFGIKLKSFEEQAVSILQHWLEVYEREVGLQWE